MMLSKGLPMKKANGFVSVNFSCDPLILRVSMIKVLTSQLYERLKVMTVSSIYENILNIYLFVFLVRYYAITQTSENVVENN